MLSKACKKMIFPIIVFFILKYALIFCQGDQSFINSRATFYGSPDCLGTASGACGFGEYGRMVNNGVVSGVSKLYRNGTGCGACYQVRCKVTALCNEDGTSVIVTDYGEGDNTDFILSVRAYSNLARPNMAPELIAHGVVNVEYRRVPCLYDKNLMIKVHEHSKFPDYLAILAIYQTGLYDITDVQVWREDCKEWRAMRRAYGAVWDMANPPLVALNLRLQVVKGGYGIGSDVEWVQLSSVIPSDWKAGVAYDTNINVN